MKPENPRPWGETQVVGKPLPRVDAHERVSGTAVYTLDLQLPGMLHAAVLRCPHAHALVKKVDVSKAGTMPGVRAVLTDADPEARIPWHIVRNDPWSRLFDPHCRYAGEEVAALCAETPQQAHDALGAIDVTYDILPHAVDWESAWKKGAYPLFEGTNTFDPARTYARGDVEKGFAEADVVLEATYRTPCEIHAPLEVHVSVAQWEESRLVVWDSTQGVFAVQQELAECLKLPLSSVRVIGHYLGGGFGSKLGLGKHTVIAALLARKTGRPVKLALSRQESFLCVGNRPANTIWLKAGVKKDGTLAAFDLKNWGASGAYPAGTTVGFQVGELYACRNVRMWQQNGVINAGQARAMRAPGFPQCSWALEQMVDALAEKLGMDPVELRLKNVPAASQMNGNLPYTSTGLARCLQEGAAAFGWKAARARPKREGHLLRGSGVASSIWGYAGGPPSTVVVKLFADGSVNLNMGAADIGTGAKTVMAMVVSEELGVSLDKIQIEHADTGTTQFTEPSGGSKTVPSDGPAVRAACLDVKQKLRAMAAEHLKHPAEDLLLAHDEVHARTAPEKKVALKDLPALQQQQVVLGVGSRHPNPEGKVALPFSTDFAEVEVNELTGEVRVTRFLGVHDSGRVMNRLTYDNQVFGGMTMGLGFGMTERRVMDPAQGKMVNANWHDYKIPTAKDVPAQFECLPVDPGDTECNTLGAKGLGEPATIAVAAAVANAVYHATGVRVTDTPINPTQMVQLLAKVRKAGEP